MTVKTLRDMGMKKFSVRRRRKPVLEEMPIPEESLSSETEGAHIVEEAPLVDSITLPDIKEATDAIQPTIDSVEPSVVNKATTMPVADKVTKAVELEKQAADRAAQLGHRKEHEKVVNSTGKLLSEDLSTSHLPPILWCRNCSEGGEIITTWPGITSREV